MSTDTEATEWYFGVPFPSKRAQATAEKERVLKVGDRVRTNGCFTFDPVRGVVVEARDDGVYRVRAEALHAEMGGRDTWTYYASELTLLPPTFTPNTRVRLIRNTQRYAVGDTGTVTVSSDESVGVHMDDGRYWSFKPEDLVVVPAPWGEKPAPNCAERNEERDDGKTVTFSGTLKDANSEWRWDLNNFIISFPPADQPCIVALINSAGKPRPSQWPHVHPDAASATAEAERLAHNNPGQEFAVYQRVAGRVAEQHIEMKVA